MADAVKIDLSGSMNVTQDEKGFQKYVAGAEQIFQQIKSGSGLSIVKGVLADRKPWILFVATDNFKFPASITRLSRRFYSNIEYFQANYLFVFLGLFAYCLITTPLLLIAIVISFFGAKKITSGSNNWKVLGVEITKVQQNAIMAAASMILFWLVGAGAILFWVLGATITVVALHASFYDCESIPERQDPEQFPMIEQI